MKKYIEPATQVLTIGMPVACMADFSVRGGTDASDADAPLRQFSGETKKITTLYI